MVRCWLHRHQCFVLVVALIMHLPSYHVSWGQQVLLASLLLTTLVHRLSQLLALLTCMTGLAGQLQNGAETASMLPSASWGTGEPLLLASVILTTFLCVCLSCVHC